MTDTDLGAHAGDIFAKAFTLGYETGRKYIPAGGMALTAELVEDVEALVATANPYSAPAARLRALFPATEPAEEAPNLAAVAQEPRRFDPADECQNDNHDPGCGCGAQHWMTASAPAEPAEEETKAEEFCCHPKCRFTDWGGINRKHERGADCPIVPKPTSSPVVPAPTETGPWQDISEAPKHLTLIDRVGDKWTYDGDNWITPETAILPVLYINRKYAPFVAAEEG